jgi:hypothetical protein
VTRRLEPSASPVYLPLHDTGRRSSLDATKTYRYVRIGMIGAVVLLAASIALERTKVGCWQTSISAYYYTPVRAIFVGSMIAVGLSLIVYKARSMLEDVFLNLAGMLAPVVAVAPTMDVGRCWSVAPNPLPVKDGIPAEWVVSNVDNNFYALLVAGVVGLIVGGVIAVATTIVARRTIAESVERVERGTGYSLVAAAGALVIGFVLIRNWSAFYTRAHGLAAAGMFLALIASIVVKLLRQRDELVERGSLFGVYLSVAILMVAGGALISLTRVFGDHTVLWLEAWEITLFAIYWITQTVQYWNEQIEPVPVQT